MKNQRQLFLFRDLSFESFLSLENSKKQSKNQHLPDRLIGPKVRASSLGLLFELQIIPEIYNMNFTNHYQKNILFSTVFFQIIALQFF